MTMLVWRQASIAAPASSRALVLASLSQYYSTLMRLVITLLVVLGLLVGPVTAAAAQAACGHGGAHAMAAMDMPAMPGPAHIAASATKGDTCCDPNGKSHKSNGKSCMQACAATCAVAVALPASSAIGAASYARASIDLPVVILAHGLEPARLERPPKSIA